MSETAHKTNGDDSSSTDEHHTATEDAGEDTPHTPDERFEPQVLQNYSEGDQDFERDLIESYKTSVGERIPKLREAFNDTNIEEAILHSHDIKGSSGYIGAHTVKLVSSKIEALAREALNRKTNLVAAEKLFPELKLEVDETFKLLDEYMAAMSGATGGDGGGDGEDEK